MPRFTPKDVPTSPATEGPAFPDRLMPQLATEARTLPPGDWGLELKFDGYRLMTRLRAGKATLFTIEGHDWSERLSVLQSELKDLPAQTWLDGEVVAFDSEGLPNFGMLQQAFARKATDEVRYFVFDLLFLDGKDLRHEPLRVRRTLLKNLISRSGLLHVQFSDTFDYDVASLLASARRLRLEGIMAKRLDAPYQAGRTTTWVKLKCKLRQEFVVGGFTSKTGEASGLDRLLLGVYTAEGALRYCGSVQPTLTGAARKALISELQALATPASPFHGPEGTRNRFAHWLTPELVAEVDFVEWTRNNHIRNASFVGTRGDKSAKKVHREFPLEQSELISPVKVTHADKVLDASNRLTKLDLVQYAEAIAQWALPHLQARPASLLRAPDGIEHEMFFQKHAQGQRLSALTELPRALFPNHPPLLAIQSSDALVNAAQMNVLELHTWNASVPDLAHPDRLIFDLDPDPSLRWSTVQEAATLVKTILDELGLRCWLKTSGGKGLHIVVPLEPVHSWPLTKDFSKAVAQHLARVLPVQFSATSGPRNRIGKIFVDYLRNSKGATTVAAYSTRARAGLRVSMPVAWEELKDVRSADQWSMKEAVSRMQQLQYDPWEGYWTCPQQLTADMWEILGLNPPTELA